MKFCINCGHKLDENTFECPNCINNLNQETVQQEEPAPEPNSSPSELPKQETTMVLESELTQQPIWESPIHEQDSPETGRYTGQETSDSAPGGQYIPPVVPSGYEYDQPYSPPPFGYGDNRGQPESSVITGLKRIGSSPLMIIACVFLSLVVIFSGYVAIDNVLSFDLEGSIKDAFDNLKESFDFEDFDSTLNEFSEFIDVPGSVSEFFDDVFEEIEDIIDSAESAIKWVVFTSNIVPVIFLALILLGMWLHVGSSFSKKPNHISTAGLTIIKTIAIIRLVGVILALVSLPAGYFVLNSVLDNSTDSGLIMGAYIVVVVIAAIFFTLPLLYYIGVIRTMNGLKKASKTGIATKNISGLVAGINKTLGVLFIISAVVSILVGLEIIGLIIALSNAGFYLLTGIVVSKYKKSMQEIPYMSAPVF